MLYISLSESKGGQFVFQQRQIVSRRKANPWKQWLMKVITKIVVITIMETLPACTKAFLAHGTCCTHVLSEIKAIVAILIWEQINKSIYMKSQQ